MRVFDLSAFLARLCTLEFGEFVAKGFDRFDVEIMTISKRLDNEPQHRILPDLSEVQQAVAVRVFDH